MNRRVRQKCRPRQEKDETKISSKTLECGCLTSATISGVDWTTLPDDTVIQLFSCLNYRDRASLASTCRTFRLLGSSPCLWGLLDLRPHKFDTAAAVSLSPRCKNLQRLKFLAAGSADAIVSLQARALREISDACERIGGDAIKALAYCCPRLQRLWMSGVKEVNGDAINALAKHCRQLKDVGFVESDNIDEVALGNLNSVKFLSVAGTRNLKWGSAAQIWSRLPCLMCLVSRTDVNLSAVTGFLSSSQNLKGQLYYSVYYELHRSQEEVQERAATAVATFVVIDDEIATVDCKRAEAILWGDGIRLLLNLSRSCQEGLQSEAAKAIANLSIDSKVAKVVAESGGINILVNLAKSMNRLGAIAEAGGIKALVDLIFKWPSSSEGLLERVTGALANLGADEKCSLEVVVAGGIHDLATRALANLVAHGDSNRNNASIGQEEGALEALVQLTCSQNEGVRQEAAGALWNLSFDDKNREAIAAAGGVEALVALAQSSSSVSRGLQERVAGALGGFIAIGRQGGIAPLIALARSDIEDVHETAAGALWNLAFYRENALHIVQDGGVKSLIHRCSSSISKMARFMAALALVYMFDGRKMLLKVTFEVPAGPSSSGSSKTLNMDGVGRMALKHVEEFVSSFYDAQTFHTAAASLVPTALAQIAEAIRIQEAGHLRCRKAPILCILSIKNDYICLIFILQYILQFTLPGGRHALHHSSILHSAGALRVLRAAAAASTATIQAKICKNRASEP
ncbi:hypothetical protein V6N13_125428 [Hibiscus sabdariffa]|uniref:F-box domain-containing protein n=1 Tax=Hibiscus sabdariffa TaxID=183260 RepID=A0ABR2U6F7_9ROSI